MAARWGSNRLLPTDGNNKSQRGKSSELKQLEFLLSTCFWYNIVVGQLKVHCSLQGSTVTDSCRHEPCELHSAAPSYDVCSGSFFNTQSVALCPRPRHTTHAIPRPRPTSPPQCPDSRLAPRARALTSHALKRSRLSWRPVPFVCGAGGRLPPPLSAAEVYRAHKRHRPHRSSHETQSRHDTEDGASQPTHAHAT